MSSALRCSDLAKRYPGQQGPALGDDGTGVSFEVERGELFALLGPSGCGKTTILRIIGGFVEPDSGSITIDGQDVTRRAPYQRPTNTVFQSYALFPHMRLGTNVEFGLKMAGQSRKQREQRVSEVLDLVGLHGMERRKIAELSGGQQQRAALARALATRPSVLLLDEPLGALDLKLRRQMQDELVALKQETATTFIHVTHDQEEACAIADRIAIMDRGRIVQIDTPEDLYRSPRTTHVARFINVGTVVGGQVRRSGNQMRLEAPDLTLEGHAPSWLTGCPRMAAVLPRGRVTISTEENSPAANQLAGVIQRCVFTGSEYDIHALTQQGLNIQVSIGAHAFVPPPVGARIFMTWRPEDVLFVVDNDQELMPGSEPSEVSITKQ
ncbi:spermidine/putrescine ABC transporter ATP-binding protein [Mesorhizobium sp. Root102]|uniref:ABC transporter ATP-binding protein n=1 Tax=Mesorhizobium sp. Root102 TaxID=1736422 RepID=UPI0006F95B66|nr:ABC transporter ATP-binding protein [Mesorhizobium sp. Root102]KQU85596.1 spermidine/putrescine ABC transporter ATP-binding protein [Mesorhizobium sp. Root102]